MVTRPGKGNSTSGLSINYTHWSINLYSYLCLHASVCVHIQCMMCVHVHVCKTECVSMTLHVYDSVCVHMTVCLCFSTHNYACYHGRFYTAPPGEK